MQFYTLEFIIGFTLFFWAFWLCCRTRKTQNLVLLLASYAFYAYFDWRCLLLLLITSITTYSSGLLMKCQPEKRFLKKDSRWWAAFGAIALNLAILGYFKYAGFLTEIINDLSLRFGGTGINSTLHVILPIGISFYTFSSISYVVDCYRKQIEPTKDIVACLLYISFFPAILSGPIHKATKQLPQYLQTRVFDADQVLGGFKDFLWGAFMKLCVAERLGMYVDAVYSNLEFHNGTSFLLSSLGYTLQIYADFAGYSLMAIGLGSMLGIKLQTNFIRPYFSKTITEFWSKWHMSLTGWFKEYVYFPLGGNRVSKARWIFNIMAVFLLSGLWHGAAYTFIIWGAIHGIAQVIEKLAYGQRMKSIPKGLSLVNVLRIVLTFSIVSFAWIFFRMPSAQDAFYVIKGIFTNPGAPFIDMHTLFFAGVSLAIMVVKDVIDEYVPRWKLLKSNYHVVSFATCIVLLMFILLMGKLDGSSFIYFQF